MDGSGFEKLCQILFDSEDEIEEDQRSPTIRAVYASSTFIDDFIQADLDAGMQNCEFLRQGDSQQLDELLHKTIQTFFSFNRLPFESLSVKVNLFDFPPSLSSRSSNRLLRPVIIDGCAVSGCFDKNYSVYWGNIKNSAKLSWTRCKVLSMKPIYKCLLHFLLLGHKVSVLLPGYYRNASLSGLRMKVDDVEAYSVLLNLQIIRFTDTEVLANVGDIIRAEVDKVDALLISSGNLDDKKDDLLIPSSNLDNSSDTEHSLHPDFTCASCRMLTPIFFGRNQSMVMVFSFHIKENGIWKTVPEELICNYDSLDWNTNIDDAGKLCEQLLFSDQVELLIAIKDLFEWQTMERRGIAAILRLSFLEKSLS